MSSLVPWCPFNSSRPLNSSLPVPGRSTKISAHRKSDDQAHFHPDFQAALTCQEDNELLMEEVQQLRDSIAAGCQEPSQAVLIKQLQRQITLLQNERDKVYRLHSTLSAHSSL